MKNLLRVVLIVLIVAGCSKSSGDDSGGSFRVIHASPNCPAMDIYIDGALSTGNVLYGSNSGYVLLAAGGRSVNLIPTGTTTPAANLTITVPINLSATLLTADSIAKMKTSIVVDNGTLPPTGKAGLRFFNCVAGGPPYSLSNGSVNFFTNRSFFDQDGDPLLASYLAIDPGVINFEIKLPGSSTPVATLSAVNVQAGKNYTIIAKGFTAGTGAQAVSLGIFNDN